MTSRSSMKLIRMVPRHPRSREDKLRTGQGIRPSPVKSVTGSDLLDQPGPVFPVLLRTFVGFQDAGDPVVFVDLARGHPRQRHCNDNESHGPECANPV